MLMPHEELSQNVPHRAIQETACVVDVVEYTSVNWNIHRCYVW